MRIVQLLPTHPTEYEKKSQRIDHALIVENDLTANIRLIYGKPPVSELPEAVEESYFANLAPPPNAKRVGSFRRKSIRRIVEQTAVRLHRTRDDVEWLLFDHVPTPADFASIDVWVDPTADENDFDGFVAEALVSGKIVVACRTSINVKRLEKGRIGLLVPPDDANELSHAILAALFKPEVAQQKIEAAQQTISKFHPRQRLRALTQMLQTIRP